MKRPLSDQYAAGARAARMQQIHFIRPARKTERRVCETMDTSELGMKIAGERRWHTCMFDGADPQARKRRYRNMALEPGVLAHYELVLEAAEQHRKGKMVTVYHPAHKLESVVENKRTEESESAQKQAQIGTYMPVPPTRHSFRFASTLTRSRRTSTSPKPHQRSAPYTTPNEHPSPPCPRWPKRKQSRGAWGRQHRKCSASAWAPKAQEES